MTSIQIFLLENLLNNERFKMFKIILILIFLSVNIIRAEWSEIDLPANINMEWVLLRDIDIHNENIVCAISGSPSGNDNYILLSRDTGLSWNKVFNVRYSQDNNTFEEVLFIEDSIGYYRRDNLNSISKKFTYPSGTISLDQGDKLFLYTDGIPEAMNDSEEMFEDDRLIETLGKLTNEDGIHITKNVLKTVKEFVLEAPQYDDMTILVFEYLKKLG